MKTTHKALLIASLVSGLASLSLAGPGIRYWQNQNLATIQPATYGACEHMLIRNTGPNAGKVTFISVACTPELKANDSACQSHCRL
jgi:hypothetical protein